MEQGQQSEIFSDLEGASNLFLLGKKLLQIWLQKAPEKKSIFAKYTLWRHLQILDLTNNLPNLFTWSCF